MLITVAILRGGNIVNDSSTYKDARPPDAHDCKMVALLQASRHRLQGNAKLSIISHICKGTAFTVSMSTRRIDPIKIYHSFINTLHSWYIRAGGCGDLSENTFTFK